MSLALDPKENIYLAVRSGFLTATPGSFTPAPMPERPIASNFVIKLNATASEVLLISPGTEFSDTLIDLTVDTEGNIYAAGLAAAAARTAPPYLRELVSRDGGTTWSLIQESSFSESDGRSGRIVVHPKDAGVLLEPGRGGIFRSAERGGANWTKIGAALEPYITQRLFIQPSTPNLMFAQIVQAPDTPSIFRSEDSGATWTPVSFGATHHSCRV